MPKRLKPPKEETFTDKLSYVPGMPQRLLLPKQEQEVLFGAMQEEKPADSEGNGVSCVRRSLRSKVVLAEDLQQGVRANQQHGYEVGAQD